MATKALVLCSVATVGAMTFHRQLRWLGPQQLPKYQWFEEGSQPSLASSIMYVATIILPALVNMYILPASIRSMAVLHGGPVIVITSRCVRSAVAFARHNDPFYFDKQNNCDVYVGFICPQLFIMAGFFALVDTPTLQSAAALFFVALVAVAFGACRNDVLEVCAVLAYTAVLVALMVRSRTSVRLYVNHHRRGDRESRIVADGVSNWAAPSGTMCTASNSDDDDDDGDGDGDRSVEGENGCGGGKGEGGGGEGVHLNSDEKGDLLA